MENDWEWNLSRILRDVINAVAARDWEKVENEAERLKDWDRTCRKQLKDGKFEAKER